MTGLTQLEREMMLASIVRAARDMRNVHRYPEDTVIHVDPSDNMLERCSISDRAWLSNGADGAHVKVLWP